MEVGKKNLSHRRALEKKVCSKTKGCGKRKNLSAFYTKGKGGNGVLRYESICKMCKKNKERTRYKSNNKSRKFQKEFSLEVVPGLSPDDFQRDKTLKVLRDLVLEALGK